MPLPSTLERVRAAVLRSGPPILLLAIAVAGLLLTVSGASKWWHVVNAPEPNYVRGLRVLTLGLSLVTLAAVVMPRRRIALLMGAGLAATAAPLLLLVVIMTLDAPTMSRAFHEGSQAHRLVANLIRTETNSYVPWTERRMAAGSARFTSNYNFVEGLESVSVFAQRGWYLSLVAGVIIWSLAWAADGAAARAWLVWARGGLAIGTTAFVAICFTHFLIAYYYWGKAHVADANGDNAAALRSYQKMEYWDHRYRYDLVYHMDLGRIYGRLGMLDQPDYWAMVGDAYKKTGQFDRAYEVYRTHIPNPHANMAMAIRYADTLHTEAIGNYNAHLTGLALDELHEAIALDPDNIEILYSLGMTLSKTGDYQGAIPVWKRLISDNEGVGLSSSKYYTGPFYRKAITSRAWENLAWCYFQTGRYEPAMLCRVYSTRTGKTDVADVP